MFPLYPLSLAICRGIGKLGNYIDVSILASWDVDDHETFQPAADPMNIGFHGVILGLILPIELTNNQPGIRVYLNRVCTDYVTQLNSNYQGPIFCLIIGDLEHEFEGALLFLVQGHFCDKTSPIASLGG